MSLPFQDIAEVAKAVGGIITTLIIGREAYEKFKTKKKPLVRRSPHRRAKKLFPTQVLDPFCGSGMI